MHIQKKDKIINDTIYGFIYLEDSLINELINHKYFQRLRRITQLGLANLIYPGSNHTRFQHALGSMFLMQRTIEYLKRKKIKISTKESLALKIAILLHDIGHGPFSHALEKTIVKNISHEKISLLYMEKLNQIFNKKLNLAIKIFSNNYSKKYFFHLVSSQVDMDRLDYLKRDSFYTGVNEGNIGVERIINMMNVVDDKLVIEEKGINSIEKFLFARRLMYWQVYLHKTVISAEHILINILRRAKKLVQNSIPIYSTPSLLPFLKNNYTYTDFKNNDNLLEKFSELDDYEIYTCIKQWTYEKDKVLSNLSNMIINRNLLKIKIQDKRFSSKKIDEINCLLQKKYSLSKEEASYFVFTKKISHNTYNINEEKINILLKNNEIVDLTKVSDHFSNRKTNIKQKYFLCYPKEFKNKF
tara:strand:+ start:13192 stop:14433 length:1242 start_codon:yes stop_codon:yes gene_type:complete